VAIRIRPAEPAECDALSELARRSKAHWGYEASFLEACRAELTVDATDVERLRVTVAEEGHAIVGFYALGGGPPDGELCLLFVEPARIGTGVGRALWHHALMSAAHLGFSRVRIESDPFAEGFYLAMGASRVGEAPSSSIPNRSLPLLEVEIGEAPVEVRPVQELTRSIERVLDTVGRELPRLVPGVTVEHVGATSLPDGVTKGDVDVNVRVGPKRFGEVVAALSRRFEVAQPHHWTATYASFADRLELPLGIQVTVEGSDDDFLVPLRDRLLDDAPLRRAYDEVKRAAAPAGSDAYWRAKNDFLRGLRT
jgi:GNAT superfamily N-acetyltransferase